MAGTESRNAVIYINGVEVNNTINSIEKHARQLRNEIAHLTRGTQEYEDKVRQLSKTNTILAEHRANVGAVNTTWKTITNTIKGVGATMLSFLGAGAVLSGLKRLASQSAEVGDALADVGKSAGLTDAQLQQLDKRLLSMNTRTSRMELLALAKEAGKIGYKSVDDIARFVAQADQINVALGDALGEGAVTQIGKLANIFETDLLKIGSVLNDVAAEGIASEGWQVDYLTRMSGIVGAAKLSLPELEGYGAALEAVGQTAEVSGTALNQFFLKFISNTSEFGDVAGFAKGELEALIGSEGTNAGFMAFISRLKDSSNSSGELINKMNDLGIDGSRAANILLTLANNTEEVAKQQQIATKAFEEGTSVTDEYNKKQATFGATMDRLNKVFTNMFANSLLVKGLERMVTGFTNLIDPAKKISDQLNEERIRLNSLVLTITNHNMSQEARKKAIDELKSSYPDYIKMVNVDTASNEELFSALEKVNGEYAKQIVLQRKAEAIADQAEKQATALEKQLALSDQYATASAIIKDVTGLTQKADETNQQFYNRVANFGSTLKENSAQWVTYYKAIQQLSGASTGLVLAEKNLNIEIEKFNNLLGEQESLRKKLLGPKTSNNATDAVINPVTGNDVKEETKAIKENSAAINEWIPQLQNYIDKTTGLNEKIQGFVQSEYLNGLQAIDDAFFNLVYEAVLYGGDVSAVYDAWGAAIDDFKKKMAEARAEHTLLTDSMSEDITKAAEDREAAELKVKQTEEEKKASQEAYAESLYNAGAAAVTSAETQEEAIQGVINAIREAIKERVKQAILEVMLSAVAGLPFPLNIALAIGAGAVAEGLFNQFVPQAADGGFASEVYGAQTGKKYKARVNQKFTGGYASSPMLVGEEGAEYTIPDWMMKNPYVLKTVNSLESVRTGNTTAEKAVGGGNTYNNNYNSTAMLEVLNELVLISKRNRYIVMPDQTAQNFQDRAIELNKLNTKGKR